MSHSNHVDSEGNNIPSVSEIPGVFKSSLNVNLEGEAYDPKELEGFQSWICRGLHPKDAVCCAKAAEEYYEQAAALGNDIHSLGEAFLKGERFVDGVPEYQAAVFDPVATFYRESGYTPLFIEEQMTGKEFGGTLDTAGTFSKWFWEGKRSSIWDKLSVKEGITNELNEKTVWVIDLKIKSKLDPLHPLQLYGYRELLKETKDVTADWGLIVRREKKLDKRPEIQLRVYYLPAYKEIWDASMTCWRFLNA